MVTHSLQYPPRQPPYQSHGSRAQNGVVLIIALIMLVLVSVMAAFSVRNATSSEAVSANVRQTQSANQAAETALRYCEDAVINMVNSGTSTFNISSPPSLTSVAFDASYVKDYVTGIPTSVVASNWDGATATFKILVLPTESVNRSGITSTFSRPPECMVDRLVPSTAASYSKSFSITARGFGPDVSAADLNRTRPIGSEVWMQSTIEMN